MNKLTQTQFLILSQLSYRFLAWNRLLKSEQRATDQLLQKNLVEFKVNSSGLKLVQITNKGKSVLLNLI